jgi:hypothetical protein
VALGVAVAVAVAVGVAVGLQLGDAGGGVEDGLLDGDDEGAGVPVAEPDPLGVGDGGDADGTLLAVGEVHGPAVPVVGGAEG